MIVSEVFFIMNFSNPAIPLKKYIFSFAAAFFITLILQAVLCVIFSFFSPHKALLNILSSASSYFSSFLAALFCARMCGKRGFLTGAVGADIYMALLIFFGAIIFKNSYALSDLLKIFSLSSLCGAIGGIIGINCK